MRTLSLVVGAAFAVLTVASAGAASAQAPQLITSGADASSGRLIFGRDTFGDAAVLEKTQFFFGGQNYCFYYNGWRGPGYYWCGYAWRRGYGWGGPRGWNGWHGRGGGGHMGGGHGGGHPGGGGNGGGHAGGGGEHGGGGGHDRGGHEGGPR
jgi:hypothetical protein